MSLATSLAAPANQGLRSARNLLRGGSLQSMARAVGVVLGAGMLAASYQIAYEEGRTLISGFKADGQNRHMLNQSVMLALLPTALPIQAKNAVRRSRNAWNAAMALAMDEKTPDLDRKILEQALNSLIRRNED